jgi:poly-gamma-glutamate synthase PgsB/CapB
MLPLLIAGAGLCVSLGAKFASYLAFTQQRDTIGCRVHVNGIRGKSTVTRYLSAVFREAGYYTFGKTTGSAARILQPDGQDYDFKRKGYPNINEQVAILKQFAQQKAEVAVVECMAVNPAYSKWLEDKVMQSHIGVITNVRYDHVDQMGDTLEEIAASLANTIPHHGILITAEYNPKLLGILWKQAKAKGTRIILADKEAVTTEELKGFSHFAIEENGAIALEVARLIKLPRDRAIKAMQAAQEDVGAFRVKEYHWQQKRVAWANLFAVNDRESFVELSQKLFRQHEDKAKVVILNNRHDRPTRVELFAKLVQELDYDVAITFGDFEAEVASVLSGPGKPRVLHLGNATSFRHAPANELLDQILQSVRDRNLLLVGTVNIHTEQAEALLHVFDDLPEIGQEQPVPTNRVMPIRTITPAEFEQLCLQT